MGPILARVDAYEALPLCEMPGGLLSLIAHLATHHDTELTGSVIYGDALAMHNEYHDNAKLHGWSAPNAHRH
jgi:hypothetical protein